MRGERGSYRGRAGGPGAQGGGGPRRSAPRGPVMKLENPMKVRRIKAAPPPRAGGDRDQRGGPRGPGGPPGRGGRPQGNSNPNTRQNTNTPAWAQAPPPPGDDAGAKGGVAKRFGTAPPKQKVGRLKLGMPLFVADFYNSNSNTNTNTNTHHRRPTTTRRGALP